MPLICFIELDKERGVTLEVTDEEAQIRQTITLDGQSIRFSVRTEEATTVVEQTGDRLKSDVTRGSARSEFRQTAEDVYIKCGRFTVEAESVEVSSTKDTSVSAEGSLTLESDGKLTAASKASAEVVAKQSLGIKSGTKLALDGGTKVQVSAPAIEATGKVQTKISAGTLLDLEGAKVGIRGKAQLEATAPMTSLGQSLTSVRGQLVKIEGALVKLG